MARDLSDDELALLFETRRRLLSARVRRMLRWLNDMEIVEEAVALAFLEAMRRRPERPPMPLAWITTVAYRQPRARRLQRFLTVRDERRRPPRVDVPFGAVKRGVAPGSSPRSSGVLPRSARCSTTRFRSLSSTAWSTRSRSSADARPARGMAMWSGGVVLKRWRRHHAGDGSTRSCPRP